MWYVMVMKVPQMHSWMPFHYSGGANVLTDAHNLDPVCKIPGFKQVGVIIEEADVETAEKLAEVASI